MKSFSGCVAIKDIKKGTLILQETPQCFANASEPSKIDVKRQVLLVCHKISDMIYDDKIVTDLVTVRAPL